MAETKGLQADPVREAPGAKIRLRYVGPKASKTDTLFGTRVTWRGPGDVQEVPATLVKRFLAFPGVWRLENEPWEAPQRPVRLAALADLVRDGDWATVERIAPEVFARAEAFFAERTRTLGAALPSASASAQIPEGPHFGDPAMDAPTAPAPNGVQEWASRILEGTHREIRERLGAHAEVLAREPGLFEALGQTEALGRNRRQVLDLIESVEARTLAPQTQLLPADAA